MLYRTRGWIGNEERQLRSALEDTVLIMSDAQHPLSNPFMLVQGPTTRADLEKILSDDSIKINDVTSSDPLDKPLPPHARRILDSHEPAVTKFLKLAAPK